MLRGLQKQFLKKSATIVAATSVLHEGWKCL